MTTAEKLVQINNEINWYTDRSECYESWDAEDKRHYGWLRWRQKKVEEKLTEEK